MKPPNNMVSQYVDPSKSSLFEEYLRPKPSLIFEDLSSSAVASFNGEQACF
jgi:hypothetical protein